jgi:hypothetical protein
MPIKQGLLKEIKATIQPKRSVIDDYWIQGQESSRCPIKWNREMKTMSATPATEGLWVERVATG